MMADLLLPLGLVAGAALIAVQSYRHGYANGQLSGQLQALKDLDAALPTPGPLFFNAPSSATPEEAHAWTADFLERGGEYADGQLAFKRARDGRSQRWPTVEEYDAACDQMHEDVTRRLRASPADSADD